MASPSVKVEAELGEPVPEVPDIDFQAYGRQTSPGDARKGCLLWSALIVGLGTNILILIYMFYPSWDQEKPREKWKDLPKEEERSIP